MADLLIGDQSRSDFGDHNGSDFGKTVPILNEQTGLVIDQSGSQVNVTDHSLNKQCVETMVQSVENHSERTYAK
jgi:hypothetical protein